MADIQGTITENVAEALRYGQGVYDNQGEKVGTIDNVDTETGWARAATSPLSDQALYIPFNRITSVDPREAFVSLSKEELLREYRNPPPRTIHLEKVGGETIATTREPNGYDGSSIVVDQINVDQVKKLIGEGYQVLTSESVSLGTIKRYDRTTDWMLIRQSVSLHEMLVPVTAVRRVDREFGEVHLVLSQADLQRMQHLEPVDVVFIDTKPVTAEEVEAKTGV